MTDASKCIGIKRDEAAQIFLISRKFVILGVITLESVLDMNLLRCRYLLGSVVGFILMLSGISICTLYAAVGNESYRADINRLFSKKYILKKDYPLIDSLINVVRDDKGTDNADFVNLAVLHTNKRIYENNKEFFPLYDELIAASYKVDVPYTELKKALKSIALRYSVDKIPERFNALDALWNLDKKYATKTDTIDNRAIKDLVMALRYDKRFSEADSIILEYIGIAGSLYGNNSAVTEDALRLRLNNYLWWSFDNKISKRDYGNELYTAAALVNLTENRYGLNSVITQDAMSEFGERLVLTHCNQLTDDEKKTIEKSGIELLEKWAGLKGDTLDISRITNKNSLKLLFNNIADTDKNPEEYQKSIKYFNLYKDAVKNKYGEFSDEYYSALCESPRGLKDIDKINYMREAADVAKKLYDESYYRYKHPLEMIMILSDIQKDYATAIKHLESYDFFSDISPEEKLKRLYDYACLYEDYGQYDKSHELLKRAIDFSLESEPELRDTRLPINYIKYILSYYDNCLQDDRNMSRSGILFSGANNTLKGIRQSPEDDGILTAKEVSQLNLKGTQLVVLSACQSALGEVSGEGVFGLQRGFKMAGVETIMMSLWKVSDMATRILMTKFYEGLMEGKTKRQSLLAAQKYLMEYEMPDKTGKSTGKPFSHPRYWAAFVLLDAL